VFELTLGSRRACGKQGLPVQPAEGPQDVEAHQQHYTVAEQGQAQELLVGRAVRRRATQRTDLDFPIFGY
jgi:hypothetical protein